LRAHLPTSILFFQGEMSFELDCLVEGGCLNQMNNGTEYREVRQFQSDHHLVRFYFVTRVFSTYMQSIIKDFRQGLKPDVVIVNSCPWYQVMVILCFYVGFWGDVPLTLQFEICVEKCCFQTSFYLQLVLCGRVLQI
ncbi:hypothetical protein XENOCAPTIV_015475, partial [Xenoophorus captivus]